MVQQGGVGVSRLRLHEQTAPSHRGVLPLHSHIPSRQRVPQTPDPHLNIVLIRDLSHHSVTDPITDLRLDRRPRTYRPDLFRHPPRLQDPQQLQDLQIIILTDPHEPRHITDHDLHSRDIAGISHSPLDNSAR